MCNVAGSSARRSGSYQLVQALLADCKVDIEAARRVILATARKRDRGEDVTMDVSMSQIPAHGDV